jgi:uncharacterized repeat protein (TIGR03803 family)
MLHNRHSALSAVATLFLTACGGSQPPVNAPSAMPQSHAIVTHAERGGSWMLPEAGRYKTIVSFHGKNGAFPLSGLTALDGELYGTTAYGGGHGNGSVFSVDAAGNHVTLHAFTGGYDGSYPAASLTAANGSLYGTTAQGGGANSCVSGCGTVFEISPSGAYRVLYVFQGGRSDGESPLANLLLLNGRLYGTTESGGAHGKGTVFRVRPRDGVERLLYSFHGGSDGQYPISDLTTVAGKLYGTTFSGGNGPINACYQRGCGTVFSITTSGAENVVYSFNGESKGDGAEPEAGLTEVDGTLYGTTLIGGGDNDGSVFSVTPGGAETVLRSFGALAGNYPQAALLASKGELYGTTTTGGTYGGGTLFKISTSGEESTLHSFGEGSTGERPYGTLISVKQTLFGTTAWGGKHRKGTVFTFTP